MATESQAELIPETRLTLRAHWYALIGKVSKHGSLGGMINICLVILIILSVLASMLQTVQSLHERYYNAFYYFEVVTIIIFTIEYLVRIWTIPEHPSYSGEISGRLRYIFSPLALIDLASILPFYLPFIIPLDLRFLRLLRLLRMLRILKLGRYSDAALLIIRVIKDKIDELTVTFMVSGIILVLSSCLIYIAEHEVQPQKFTDIFATLWWSVITMTSVGYGDVFPITPFGKFLACIIALLGVGLFALPISILGAGFVGEIQKKKAATTICPHCGKSLGE